MVMKEKPRKRPRVPPNSATFGSKYLDQSERLAACKWYETDQGGEGVDQLLCLNCDVGGRVPENQAKTIVRGTLKRIVRGTLKRIGRMA